MPNQLTRVDTTFTALADPTRRAVIERLAQGPATVSQLASPFAMALPSFTQHLGVLENAGLIQSRREGRVRICSLDPDAMHVAEAWLATHRQRWEQRLDRLAAHLATQGKKETSDE